MSARPLIVHRPALEPVTSSYFVLRPVTWASSGALSARTRLLPVARIPPLSTRDWNDSPFPTLGLPSPPQSFLRLESRLFY